MRIRRVMTQVDVRRVEAGDFDEWFALFEQVAVEGLWIGAEAPVDRASLRRGFDRRIGSESSVRFLAVADEMIVGDIFIDLQGGRADLGMMVRDGYRRQGIGSALMDACVGWCRSKAAHKITLTVWPHNEAAVALYLKFGFSVEGRLLRHYRRTNGELWDAIPMGRVLDDVSPSSARDDAPALSPVGQD